MTTDTTASAAENALVSALNHLKHYEFDREFLGNAEPVDADHLPQTFFSFEIAGKQFAVNAQSYCEVLSDVSIAAIPNSPEQLAGLCNLRGLLVPVFQLHHSFDKPLPRKNIIFCIGKGEKTLGLLVDALPVSIILRPYEQLHENAQDHALIKLLSDSAYFSKGRVLHLLDGNQLGDKLIHLNSDYSKKLIETQATNIQMSDSLG